MRTAGGIYSLRGALAAALLTLPSLVQCVPPPPTATPAVAPSRVDEPPPTSDRDGDGIRDTDDRCPDDPEDHDGFEDDDGCPDPDNDHDRILDARDKCPNEPETYNGIDDDDGCPDGSSKALAVPPSPPPASSTSAPPSLNANFMRYRDQARDLTLPGLLRRLKPPPPTVVRPSFDVRSAKYFDRVTDAFHMTTEERQLLTTTGLVSIDRRQRYTMGSAYYTIYGRDLPVLVTTDSVLHALHRSYDAVLEQLEKDLFSELISSVLADTHARLATAAGEATSASPLADSLHDVDLYLTVARNLMAGAAALPDEGRLKPQPFVPSKLGQDAAVRGMLERIGALVPAEVSWNGETRTIDFSQFRARGHYALTAELRRYFRTMMWLGRPDTGFVVGPTAATRGLRAAATLALLVEQAGGAARLQSMSDIIDFMVGAADDGTILEMGATMKQLGLQSLGALSDDGLLAPLSVAVARGLANRSQILGQTEHGPAEPPKVVQLFGQRFALDSYLLSQVVFDKIVFQGQLQNRTMPSGLDVMAALGNDEAVRLLAPEIDRFHYAANLVAARRIVDDQPAEQRNASLYGIWLDALRTLDDRPAGAGFPQAMRTVGWRRKQLQTQLASWAELRHDTLLYVKQGYVVLGCSYPDAYVEPYPAFFARLAELATEAARRLKVAPSSVADEKRRAIIEGDRASQVAFFSSFAEHMRRLETLARKELAGQPFTQEERLFLKQTMRQRPGSGAPTFDGWYPSLLYARDPLKWSPTIVDVHSDPNSGNVLEEAVGDVNFLVVAVDNRRDHAIYVGPAYSYYELEAPMTERMTNEQWQQRLESGSVPARPAWTAPFQAAPLTDTVDGRPAR